MKLVFAGTSEFALPCLEALADAGHQIELVITQTDKPSGRGKHLGQSPVKTAAIALGLDVFQPVRISEPDSVDRLLSIPGIDVFIVVAYGQKIPKVLLDWPKFGVFNVHGSLLPKYRGAAPIQQAIIDGATVTGVTTMLLGEGWDSGPILLRELVDILPEDDAQTLSERMSNVGAKLLLDSLKGVQSGMLVPALQDENNVSYAYSLKSDAGAVDWNRSADEIVNLIRGCNPRPGAYSSLNGVKIKIWKARACETDGANAPAGRILQIGNEGVWVASRKGRVLLLEVQPESRKRMNAGDWARGINLNVNNAFDM